MLRQGVHGQPACLVIGSWASAGENGVDQLLHEFNGVAQQQMVLARAMMYSHEQFVIFLDQCLDQRTVIGGEAGNDDGKPGVLAQPHEPRHITLMLFAFAAHSGDGFGLGVDIGDVRKPK